MAWLPDARRAKEINQPLWLYLQCAGRDLRTTSLSDEMIQAADSSEVSSTFELRGGSSLGQVPRTERIRVLRLHFQIFRDRQSERELFVVVER